ncbi:MAG: hypothetical protein Q9177_001466 [Variospora cf. flavescens]
MADQSKSPFSFGNTTSSGTPGGLFGQQGTTSQSQGSLFGTNSKPPGTSGPSPFSTNTATTTAAAATGGGSVFGKNNTATAPSSDFFSGGGVSASGDKPTSGFNFGQKAQGQPGSGGPSLFGQAQSSVAQQPGTAAPFQAFATPSKPTNSVLTGQPSNVFGGGGISNIFQNPTSSDPATAATPASKPTYSFGPVGSTTPAHPPPSSQATGSNLYGINTNNNSQHENKSFFPSLGAGTSSSQPSGSSSIAPSQNATGSGSRMFTTLGNPQGSSSAPPPPSTGGSNLFGNTGNQTSTATAGGQPAATSLFAKPNQSLAAEAQKPSFSLPSSSTQAQPQDAQQTQTSAPSLFNLGAPSKPTQSSAPGSSAPATSMFGNIGKASDASKSAAPSTSAGLSFFGNVSKAQDTPSSTAGDAKTSSQAPAPIAASASSQFGKLGQPDTSSAAPQSGIPATETRGNTNAVANATFGKSTSGPAPSAQSRLKNKSMDEIITRWASDLAKYQKEFQKQAEKVAMWDHMLVENSEKIQKLYGSTLDAERATAEVERQITAVENDQDELESWLARYEEKVDQMISSSGDSLHGPDLERERTYQLAEKLSTRLDEMGRDLGSMIEEINHASSSLNKNTKPDDPLSQVVRVLNSHLTQLQQIDQGAAALQLKVAAAQRASQSLSPTNGLHGPSSDAADSFYRSFMGRR